MALPKNSASWLPIPESIAVAMLASVLMARKPYGYFVILRFVVCSVYVYLALTDYRLGENPWIWEFAMTGFICNPVFRIHLNGDMWLVLNVVGIAIMVIWIVIGCKAMDAGT